MAKPDSMKSEFQFAYRAVRAPRGTALTCKGWQQEAALRMLMNSLDEEIAEHPQDLRADDGASKVASDWTSYHAIVEALKGLGNDETLLVQAGKPSGVFRTREEAPRVLITETQWVGQRTDGEESGERLGLMLHGQTSAASWTSTGAQGILHGTFEVFAAAAQKRLGGDLAGKLVVAGGMGRMGGAQPLAATMNGAAFLGIEIDAERIKRRVRTGYCDICVNSLDEAIRILKNVVRQKRAVSVGLVGNSADVIPEMARRGIVPDLLTDQTGAHDPLNGYVPSGLSLEQAAELRFTNPQEYLQRAYESIARQVTGMLELQKLGAATFEYGNHIRALAFGPGRVKDAFTIPEFVVEYVRPLFSEGRSPCNCVALSGEPRDIHRIDTLAQELFPNDVILNRWLREARKHVRFEGLPARVCVLDHSQRSRFGERINDLVAIGELKAPIVIARGQADCGSVASPFAETEDIKEGSAARPASAALNALVNAASGASWVSFQHVGGGGIGYSLNADQVTVADGTPEMAKRLKQGQ
jgi:urocanate hydratase